MELGCISVTTGTLQGATFAYLLAWLREISMGSVDGWESPPHPLSTAAHLDTDRISGEGQELPWLQCNPDHHSSVFFIIQDSKS